VYDPFAMRDTVEGLSPRICARLAVVISSNADARKNRAGQYPARFRLAVDGGSRHCGTYRNISGNYILQKFLTPGNRTGVASRKGPAAGDDAMRRPSALLA